jgi:PAS domain S-box-containing protein
VPDQMTVEGVLHLPPSGTSTREARRFVASTLRRMELDHLEDAATLAVSELVTNAVLHARTEIDVTVRSDHERVCVTVGDLSTVPPVARSYGAYATTGRGVGLVTAVVDDLGVRPREDGKAISFTLFRSPADDNGLTDATGPGVAAVDVSAGTLDLGLWDIEDGDGPGHQAQESDEPAGGGTAILGGLPVSLWLAAQQYHDAALRELVLYRGPRIPESHEAWAWYAGADAAHTTLSAAVHRAVAAASAGDAPLGHLGQGHPSPAPAVPATVTVEVPLEPHLPGALAALAEALDDADRLAAAEELLIHPALPEIVMLRDWCCHQVIAQAAGAPPGSWQDQQPRADHPHGASRPVRPLAAWDSRAVTGSRGAVVAVDDGNRIVALSAAAEALLGWAAEDLVGRRVVTLMPARLREAHVAGFTRHQVSGESHVLGVEVTLPVLHADGHEFDCTFLIERVPASGGRSVYLASLTPL